MQEFLLFDDETFVSFVVNEKTPDNNGYFKTPSGNRLQKWKRLLVQILLKTNLLKILPFLKWLIVDSLKIPLNPYLFDHLLLTMIQNTQQSFL